MTNATNRLLEGNKWSCYSDYFFAGSKDNSNALFFAIAPNGANLSAFLLSHFDVSLYGNIKIEVLDPNYTNSVTFQAYDQCDVHHFSLSHRVRGLLKAEWVWYDVNTENITMPTRVLLPIKFFIPLETLRHRYVMDNSLYFCISYTSSRCSHYSRSELSSCNFYATLGCVWCIHHIVVYIAVLIIL